MPSTLVSISGIGVGILGSLAAARLLGGNAGRPPKRQRDWNRTFTVCQYNVLGDGKYANMEKYNRYSTPADRAWNRRFPLLMSEMDGYAADIYCLEEVQHHRFKSHFRPAFESRGYTPILCARKGKRCTKDTLNVMIATRNSAIRVLDVQSISLSSELRTFMATHQQHLSVDAEWISEVESKDNEVLVALCEHINTRNRMAVACTHLHWDPREPEVKSIEAAMLCGALSRILKEWGMPSSTDGKIPLVLCGDFNSQPASETGHGGMSGVYRLMTEGNLPNNHPDHPASPKPQLLDRQAREAPCPGFPPLDSSNLLFQSVYKLMDGHEPAYTTLSGSFSGTLDFIFIPQNSPFKVVDTLSLPHQANTPSGMPNKDWPSDHFALATMLQFE